MCSNYTPVTREDRLLGFFDAPIAGTAASLTKEVWPLGLAPFIRISDNGKRVAEKGQFGLLPGFAKEVQYGRRTYNARSETVAKLASFRTAWAKGQRCIVPAESIFEPCWETGSAVRWCIQQPGQVPMGIAGVYAQHPWLKREDGTPHWSFAMLTVNADGHVVFKRMHRPEDEKRMVVILDPKDYDEWLTCSVDEAPKFFRQWLGELDAFAAPLPPRASKPRKTTSAPPPPDSEPDIGSPF